MTTTRDEHEARIRPGPAGRRGAFTLTELLVAIGIIAVLAALTALSIRGIAKDARMASSGNTLIAALDNARALAMKENRLVMVVFRPRWDGPRHQYIELVTCTWAGESARNTNATTIVVDRFVPIPDAAVRRLSTGVKISGPRFGETGASQNYDKVWVTQVHLPGIDKASGVGEFPGAMLAVMYGPDGATRTRNAQSCADRFFVDFNLDHRQRDRTTGSSYIDYDYDPGGTGSPSWNSYFEQDFEDDEPYITFAPFLAVFDDDEARELRTSDWNTENEYAELVGSYNPASPYYNRGFITDNSDRIHFNRYTGVAMK